MVTLFRHPNAAVFAQNRARCNGQQTSRHEEPIERTAKLSGARRKIHTNGPPKHRWSESMERSAVLTNMKTAWSRKRPATSSEMKVRRHIPRHGRLLAAARQARACRRQAAAGTSVGRHPIIPSHDLERKRLSCAALSTTSMASVRVPRSFGPHGDPPTGNGVLGVYRTRESYAKAPPSPWTSTLT